MTFNLCPSSTVRSTSRGRCCKSVNDWHTRTGRKWERAETTQRRFEETKPKLQTISINGWHFFTQKRKRNNIQTQFFNLSELIFCPDKLKRVFFHFSSRHLCRDTFINISKPHMTPPFSTSHLEGHKLVVRFRRPGVDLHRVLQSDHQEFNPLIFHCRRRVRHWGKQDLMH